MARPRKPKKTGRKPVPLNKRHVWTLAEIRERCGAETDDECWDHYTGMHGQEVKAEQNKRFPMVKHGGVMRVLLRRLAWLLAFGEDPPEGTKLVMAKCHNPRCQNPYHAKAMFEPQKCAIAAAKGNFSTQSRRMKIAAGRRAASKLDWDKVAEIRACTLPHKDEPWKKWGICLATYKRIRSYQTWVPQDSPMARMAA